MTTTTTTAFVCLYIELYIFCPDDISLASTEEEHFHCPCPCYTRPPAMVAVVERGGPATHSVHRRRRRRVLHVPMCTVRIFIVQLFRMNWLHWSCFQPSSSPVQAPFTSTHRQRNIRWNCTINKFRVGELFCAFVKYGFACPLPTGTHPRHVDIRSQSIVTIGALVSSSTPTASGWHASIGLCWPPVTSQTSGRYNILLPFYYCGHIGNKQWTRTKCAI